MIGLIYFLVIVLANAVGAVSGMGGGVLIKPIFDFIGAHSVAAISFYSATAVFTMSIVSTTRQLASGRKINWSIALWVSGGAVLGGVLGNVVFERLLLVFRDDKLVQLIQILVTVLTLLFAFLYTKYNWRGFALKKVGWYAACGLILGFLASLLGIWRRTHQCFFIDAAVCHADQRGDDLFNLYDFFLTAGKNFDDRFFDRFWCV